MIIDLLGDYMFDKAEFAITTYYDLHYSSLVILITEIFVDLDIIRSAKISDIVSEATHPFF